MIDYILKEKEKHVFFCAFHILKTPGFHYRIQKKGLTVKYRETQTFMLSFQFSGELRVLWGSPWQFSGSDSTLPMQGTWI